MAFPPRDDQRDLERADRAAGIGLGERDRVARDPRGVAIAAKDQFGRPLIIGDQRRLEILMDRRFAGRAETGAHVDPVSPQRQRSDQPPAIAETATGQDRHADPVGRRRDQDQAGNIILAGSGNLTGGTTAIVAPSGMVTFTLANATLVVAGSNVTVP